MTEPRKIDALKALIRKSGSSSQLYYTTLFCEWAVSTMYRRSSAMLAPDHWYEETFVWKLEGQRKLIGECPEGNHWDVCARIVRDCGWKAEDEKAE